MSKNISKLSGRIGLKNNLFQKISDRSLNSNNSDGIKEIAEEYNMGVSTIHGAESFYEFLRPAHREKKAFVCNGSACMCAGTQDSLKKKLKEKLGDDKVGEMFCLGHCYENSSFHYNGENYAGNDIDKIDQIIKGENITQQKFVSKSFASTSFLMDDKLLNLDQFKSLLEKFINFDKKEIVKLLLNSNLSGRGGAGFPTAAQPSARPMAEQRCWRATRPSHRHRAAPPRARGCAASPRWTPPEDNALPRATAACRVGPRWARRRGPPATRWGTAPRTWSGHSNPKAARLWQRSPPARARRRGRHRCRPNSRDRCWRRSAAADAASAG